MASPKPPRWRRTVARRYAGSRRFLGWGAVAGAIAAVLAQPFIAAAVPSNVESLARLAMFLPAICFIVWWVLTPTDIESLLPPQSDVPTIDPEARVEQIEATFDAAAVPRPNRNLADGAVDGKVRAKFQKSIRRTTSGEPVAPEYFGIRRPKPSDPQIKRPS